MSLRKVYLELTSSCNLNCTMCYRKTWKHADASMDEKLIDKAITEINACDTISDVVLGGIGEPTFYDGIVDVLYKLKQKNLILTSNGTISNEALVKEIVECVDMLVISVDGLHETFYKIRQTSLDGIIKNIKLINEEKKKQGNTKLKILFQIVISKENKNEIFDIIKLAGNLGVSEVILSNLQPTTLDEYDLVLYKRYENKKLKEFFNRTHVHGMINGVKVRFPAYELKTERRCRFIINDTTMVNFDGTIAPCYRLAHDCKEVVFGREKEVLAYSFGNLAETKLIDIWNSEEYVRFRDVIYNNHYPSCIDCDWVDGCDYVNSTTADCYGNQPSCSDCLWSRDFTFCI